MCNQRRSLFVKSPPMSSSAAGCFGFTNLYGCEIGDDVKIGTFVEIQKGARIGSRCKISSHTFICEGVVLEDEVFVGHNVTFINDLYPRSTNGAGQLQTEADWKCVPTLVRKGASIGSGATLVCSQCCRDFCHPRRSSARAALSHATCRPTPLWQATRPECCAWPFLTPSD